MLDESEMFSPAVSCSAGIRGMKCYWDLETRVTPTSILFVQLVCVCQEVADGYQPRPLARYI